MPLDTTIDPSAAALLGVIALERILPLISVVRAANDEGYDTDLRTVTLAWQLAQLGAAEPLQPSGRSATTRNTGTGDEASEYSQNEGPGLDAA